ncbi:PGF-pre-PGF domain-containing protein [Methanolobus sp. ZRKC3]|uniref:PGF-pre-PGF domain-containing protein n=1 Tax=Methanolobus sp. ZRKC3 TaxID=3125786 RepID=UPI003247FE25
MHKKCTILLSMLLIFSLTSLISATAMDNTNDNSMILLRTEYIDTSTISIQQEPFNSQATMSAVTQVADDRENYYIVQFNGPVNDIWKDEVRNTGAAIFNYVPNNAFIIRMNSTIKAQVYLLDNVKWIGEYKPSYKYVPEILDDENIYASGAKMETKDTFHVLLFSSSDNEKVTSSIEAIEGDIHSNSGNVIKVQIPKDRIYDIASINGVSWIEEYTQPTIKNDVAAGIINVDTVLNNYGLNGSGQIIAVCDTGLDTGVNDNTMHADLRGRILNITDLSNDGSSADQFGHGTHVAGSALGNGLLSGGQYSGMAPEAELVFQAIGNEGFTVYPPDDLSDMFQPAYDDGARIHTNSWGGAYSGEYTIESQQVDQFMWEHPDMLILFSAGNSGKDSDSNGVTDNDSMGSPSTAKNCLTVGASENYRPTITAYTYGSLMPSLYPANPIKDDYLVNDIKGIVAFSSRGPTDDGRIKPDVVAPGTFIASTRSSVTSNSGWGIIDDNYMYMGGTSMSTPIVAGSAAIVRQYYTDVENLSSPSAALLKATLINGAIDLTPGQHGTGDHQEISGRPDYSQGWGRVDIENSIFPKYPEVIKYFDNIPLNTTGSIPNNWPVNYGFIDENKTFRTTLVWTDYPGIPLADSQLVNNLDLIVFSNGSTFYGNGAPDTSNNVEGIELINQGNGNYTISVNGTAVQQGPQNYSLVMYFTCDIDEFPQNGTYTENGTTAVSMNLTHPDGVKLSSINMTIDESSVTYTHDETEGGYRIENLTGQSYAEGYHSVSVTALTNLSREFTYDWRFYANVEENVISIQELYENAVIQDQSIDINISNRKLCDIWYNVDNGNNSTAINAFSINGTLNLDEGAHNITVFARDITGSLNSTMVNFTVFTSSPTINSPTSGSIFYLPQNSIYVNGSAGIATNVSVYVNGVISNASYPVSNTLFSIPDVPLSNGSNTINISSSFNNSLTEYFSPNTTFQVILGETLDTSENMIIQVPGWQSSASDPVIDFNISGEINNIPDNISVALINANPPNLGSILAGPSIDIRVLNGSDPNYSYQFDQNVSLTLGYEPALVNNTDKLLVAWYDPEEEAWTPFRSTVNITAETVTANITHLSIYAPIEDNTAPLISTLTGSSSTSTVTLSWQSSSDTNHTEIWRGGTFLANTSSLQTIDSELSSGTSYAYSLKPVDYAGNIGNWSNITITTSTQTTTTSSGGGGGGGGGGSTGEDFDNIEFKDVLTVYAGKDSITEFIFDGEESDILYIRYLSLKNSGKISTTIEILKNTSLLADTPAPGTVYRNLNIWVGKTGYVNEANLRDPVIGFRVKNEWIENQNIDPSSVTLRRYSETKWEKLATIETDSDEEYSYFEAKTPGFSPFAITGKSLTKAASEELDESGITIDETDDTGSNIVDSENEEELPAKNIPVIQPAFTILILLVVGLLRRQQN